jgi:hypothetical protein
MGSVKKKRFFTDAGTLLTRVFELDYFAPNDDGVTPIPYRRIEGKGRLVLFLGENASGKSFARRIVTAITRENDDECIHVSMQSRAADPSMMGGIRSFIYGTEEWQSTGECSVGTVLGGIRTCLGRETPHVMFWDEPDIGLSDSWAAGVGVAVRDFVKGATKHTKVVFVTTHSKALVSQLAPLDPHVVFFGDEQPESLQAWVDQPIVPRDIEALGKASHRSFLLIESILRRVRAEK